MGIKVYIVMKVEGETRMKKTLYIMLVCIILANFLFPNISNATTLEEIDETTLVTSNMTGERSNWNFINVDDISNLVYSYEQNGRTYLVVESIKSDYSEFDTVVYELINNKQIEIEKYTTKCEDQNGNLIFSRYKEDVFVDRNIVNLNSGYLGNTVAATSDRGTYDGYIYYDGTTGKYYTAWEYAYNDTGSTKLTEQSLAFIMSAVSKILQVAQPQYAVPIGIVQEISTKIMEVAIKDIYWSKNIWEVHQILYPAKTYYGTPIGIYTEAAFYADAAHTKLISTESYEWRDSAEWPTAIHITYREPKP